MSQFLKSIMCLSSEGCDRSHRSGNEAVPPSVGVFFGPKLCLMAVVQIGTTCGVCSLLRWWWLSFLVEWQKCFSRCGSSSLSACPSAQLWCKDHLCL